MDRSIYSIRRRRRGAIVAKIALAVVIGFVVFAPKFDVQDVTRTPLVASAVDDLQPVIAFRLANDGD
jgi:hypothetical protein